MKKKITIQDPIELAQSQLNESGQLSQSKRKRRKRTDDEGRTYTCKCGKSYLSYPALYTHIKTKHQDEPFSRLGKNYDNYDQLQQQIQKAQKQLIKQFDKNRQKQSVKQKDKQKQLQQNYPLYGNTLPEVNNIESLRQFLFKYFPNIVVNSNQTYKNQLTYQEKKQLKQMKDYWSNGKKKQEQIFTQVYDTKINNVLGKFIIQLQADVQNICYKKFVFLFIFAIKKALDKIKGQNYFKESNASELPLFFDQILREHLFLDNNDCLSNPTVGAKCLYYLGRWLFVNKFTNMSLKYNF